MKHSLFRCKTEEVIYKLCYQSYFFLFSIFFPHKHKIVLDYLHYTNILCRASTFLFKNAYVSIVYTFVIHKIVIKINLKYTIKIKLRKQKVVTEILLTLIASTIHNSRKSLINLYLTVVVIFQLLEKCPGRNSFLKIFS